VLNLIESSLLHNTSQLSLMIKGLDDNDKVFASLYKDKNKSFINNGMNRNWQGENFPAAEYVRKEEFTNPF